MGERVMSKDSYRVQLYANYGQQFQDTPIQFDVQAARRWGRYRRYQLRGWLPAERSARILDVACGRGWLIHTFIEMGYNNVHGVDISPDQVAHAQQVTPNVTQGNILEFLAEHPREFDLITGFDIVEHLHKDEVIRLLDLSYRALSPGGGLILQTPNAAGPWGGYYFFNDLTHEVGFNTNLLSRLMRMVGFEEVSARECDPPLWGNTAVSTVRAVLWRLLRLFFMAWSLIEIGTTDARVFTRNLVIRGVKPF